MVDHLAGDLAVLPAQEALGHRPAFVARNEVERHPDEPLIVTIDVLDVGRVVRRGHEVEAAAVRKFDRLLVPVVVDELGGCRDGPADLRRQTGSAGHRIGPVIVHVFLHGDPPPLTRSSSTCRRTGGSRTSPVHASCAATRGLHGGRGDGFNPVHRAEEPRLARPVRLRRLPGRRLRHRRGTAPSVSGTRAGARRGRFA